MVKKEKDPKINVHDDREMRAAGFFRPYNQSMRDESVWTKTSQERRNLKKAKYSCKKEDGHFNSIPRKIIRVRGKLIVNLIKNKQFKNTTYSMECWQHEIPELLSRFVVDKKGIATSVVRKYYWNGKTYGSVHELPFAG